MAYWYETQERAMAPGIADGWPDIIKAPHTKNGRLVRREGPDPAAMLTALKHAADMIPAPSADMNCHSGICSVEKCSRCSRAALIHAAAGRP